MSRSHRLVSGVLPGETVAPCGLLPNLIAYWPGNEAAGNALDAHTNGLDLTDTNTVTSNPGHVYALARQYTAANTECHTRASEALLQLGDVDFTVAQWVYLNSKTSTVISMSKDNGAAPNREFLLYFDSGADRFRMAVFTGGGAQIAQADNLGSPSVDTWYFLVGWHDATADIVYIQANNGVADSQATGGALAAAGGAAFRIGARDGGSPLYWSGRIGPSAMWKSAAGGGGVLTAAQRTCLWNGGAGLAYADFT